MIDISRLEAREPYDTGDSLTKIKTLLKSAHPTSQESAHDKLEGKYAPLKLAKLSKIG